jgi:hypothetical protein
MDLRSGTREASPFLLLKGGTFLEKSEVAEIRQRIQEECVALKLAMDGLAVGASHRAITARYERLGTYQDALEKLIGKQAEVETCEMYLHILG